jgi:hypothetical protein
MPIEVQERCNTIEECYEFMLAYAAQGLPHDGDGARAGEIRRYLERAADAAAGLAQSCAEAIRRDSLEPAGKYHAFFQVIARDAHDSVAAIQLVLVQPSISSQLVDNLNACIHLRALLTDLFLISEILKPQPAPIQSIG